MAEDYLDTATADTLVAIEGAARVTRHVYGIMSYVAASSKKWHNRGNQ